jgi:glycine cleavage system aminomethyltransferase T
MPRVNSGQLIARGPLVERHRAAGARVEVRDGWEFALQYPSEPAQSAPATVLADLSHCPKHELNGPGVDAALRALCGRQVPIRAIHDGGPWQAYRLAPDRALVMGAAPASERAIDVTGGWATLALAGPDALGLLCKVTAVDLRPGTLPDFTCCQGPLFAVNVLFGRLPGRYELHAAADSADFLWSVLLDAGAEFGLAPVGAAYFEHQVRA